MPELPEVETIRQQLKKYLIGYKIENVQVNYAKCITGDPKLLIGGKIINVRRFGKVQSIDLDNGYSIVIHIKMTGQLIYTGPNHKTKDQKLSAKITGGVPGKHTHVVFKLDNDAVLYYNDVRKFGWIKIVTSDKVTSDKFIGKLGPEPKIIDEENDQAILTQELFGKIISKSKKPIKLLLMDQEKIGGVGNIYANEALWLARINPRKPAIELSSKEAIKLYNAIHDVLKTGLKYGGASEQSFVTPDGAEGDYQNHTKVYGHEGEPCNRCHKGKIDKYFLSGRGTYWCPVCQC